MDSLFGGKGRLEAVFGRGWISAWEAGILEPGGVVVADTETGLPLDLVFEGRWLAHGELVVMGDTPQLPLAGLRITGLDREAREIPERDRGQDLAELLPFELCLGEVAYSLEELSDASIGSVISLDASIDAPGLVRLKLAGRLAARGRAAVVGERFAIRLDEILPLGAPPREPFFTGAWLPPTEAGARLKLYDFRRPDRFTWRTLEAIRTLHERACESLMARGSPWEGLKVGLVDQETWGEWLEAHGTRAGSLYRSVMDRPHRSYEREQSPPPPLHPLIQPQKPNHPQAEEDGAFLARWSANQEAILADKAVFLALEGSLAGAPVDQVLSALKSGWRLMTDASLGPALALDTPPLMRLSEAGGQAGDPLGLLASEMIVTVKIEAGGGRLLLVYSGRSLWPLTRTLDRHGRASLEA